MCVTGNYSSFNTVRFNDNLLTRLEEDVFKSMLQDMAVQKRAGFGVPGSKNCSRDT